MNKIFQKRVNNSDLLDSRSTLFSPKYLETWNKDGIKIVYGALKRITGSEKIKVFFNGDMTFTLIANKAYTGSLEYGDMDEMPKIRLTDGNTTNSYEVLNSNGETFINLDSETTKKCRELSAKCHSMLVDLTMRETIYIKVKNDVTEVLKKKQEESTPQMR